MLTLPAPKADRRRFFKVYCCTFFFCKRGMKEDAVILPRIASARAILPTTGGQFFIGNWVQIIV
jgi:hypothetical protein